MKQIRSLSFFVLFLFSALLSYSQSVINFNSGGNTIGCAPNPINYTISGNINAFTNYTLNFGDGSPILNYTSSTLPSSVSHTYTSISCGSSFTNGGTTCPNAFGATLTGTNSTNGQQGSWVVYPIGISQAPISSFTIASSPVCTNTPITFTNTSFEGNVYTPTGSPCAATCDPTNNLYWQLTGPSAGSVTSGSLGSNNSFPGDWEIWTSGTDVLVMSFATPGLYTMKLFVGNPCNLSGSVSTQTFCVVAQPQPQFSVNPNNGCFPPALIVAATNSTAVTANACFPTTYAYNWSVTPAATWAFNPPSTATTQNSGFTFSAVGNYTVSLSATVNGLTGCTASISHPVTVTQAPTVSAGLPQSVCAGGATLQLTGTPSGGSWSGTGVTSTGLYTSPASLAAGSVTLTYTLPAISPCPATSATVLITINPKPTVTVVPLTPAICNGNSVSLTASTSIALSTFAWSPTTGLTPSTGATVVANPTSTTAYTVTGTAPTTGCSNTAIATVTVNPRPTVSVPTPAAICVGGSTSLTATGAVGLAPYTYAWSPALGLSSTTGATVTANPTITSTYTVTVTDSRGCTGTNTVTVTVTSLPIVNAGNDLSLCTGSGGNTLTGFSPTGGTWSGAGVTSAGVFTPGSVGNVTLTYSVTQNGCVGTDQIIVSVIAPTAANAGADQGICLNAPAINLTGTPISGTWSGSTLVTSAGVFTPSTAGVYTLTYTIGSGSCLATDQKVVTVYALPSVTVNDPTTCSGVLTTLTAVGSGGLAPYTYSWSPAAGLSAATGAIVTTSPTASTSYTVTVSDAHSCTKSDVSNITVNPIPTVDAGSAVSICNGSGANTLTGNTPSGGTWSGTGVTSAGVFTPTSLGNVTLTYSVTQTGCTGSDQVLVTVIAPTAAAAGTDQGICLNAPAINLTGTPNSGNWSGSALVTSAGVFTPSTVGVYTLTYTIGSGSCLATDQKVVTVHALPTVSVNDPTICAGVQATLTAAGVGGLAPYTYSWSPSAGLSSAAGATVTTSPSASTSHTVTVSDARSCTATDVSTITVNPIPTVNAGSDVSICNGSGANTLTGNTPSGGTWSGTGVTSAGVFTPSALGNVTLTYSVTQTGCTGTDQLVVTVIAPTAANAGTDQGVCLNAPAINLIGTPSGGNWSGSGLVTSAGVFTPSAVGTYTLTYTFGTGSCTATDQKIVTVHALPTVAVNDPIICAGVQATLIASGAGGLAPYTYAWSPSAGLSSAAGATVTTSPTASTSYTVTVSDARSCTATDVSNITVNPIPTVNAGSDVSICNGSTNNTLTGFTPIGGTWSGTGVTSAGVFTPTALGNVTLTYSVTQIGCTGTDQIVVTVIAPTAANAGTDQGICLNSPAISLTGSPSGGNWTGSGLVTSAGIFTPNTVGTYTLTYTFGTGSCTATDQKIVTVHSLPTVSVNDPTICAGAQASLTAAGSGGLAPYTYAWSPSAGLSATTGASVTISPALASNITVTVSDANSCTATDVSAIIVNPIPIVNAGSDVGVCNTPNTFTLSGYTPAGGTWTGTGVTAAGVFTPNGVASVTLTYSVTQNSCIGTDVVVLNVTDPVPANAGLDEGICLNATAINLTGTPLGGTWSGDPAVSSTGLFSPNAVGNFTLTYSFGTGNCLVTDQKIVTVHALPTVTVNDQTICAGNQASLTAVGANGLGPYTYAWSPSAGLSAVTGATVTTSPSVNTSYTVTVSDSRLCIATDNSSITVNPIPTSNAGPDITICTGSGGNTLTGFSPAGGTWSGTGVTSAGIFTPTVTGLVTLTYSVIENGCTGTSELEINVINPTAADAGLNQALCQNAPDLTLIGLPVNGAWTGTNVTNTGVFTPLTAGTYTLTYTIGSGSCSASDNVEVLVYDLPIASLNDPAFCIGLGTTLTASATGGASPYSYAWNASTDLSTLIGATTIANPSVSSNFTVTVTDDNACTDTEISQVQVNTLPLVDAGSDVSVCNTPTETTLIGFSPNGGTWTGNGVTSDGIFTPTGVGNFDLTYTFTDANGCINSDIVTAAVTDPDNVQAGSDQAVCQNSPDVQLVGSPTGGNWIVSTYLTNTGIFTPSTVGDYSVKYTVGTGTCAVVDSLLISVLELPLVAGSDVTICAQDSIEISVTGSLGAGNYSYTWSPTDNLILSIDSVIQAFPVITTTYTVTVTDENTCTGTTDILVNVNQLPIVDAGTDFTVCFTPIPTVLSGESPLGGTWSGNGVTNGEYVPSAAGTDTIYYTYTEVSTGCINLDSILITANNPAIVNAGNDTSVCVTYDPFLITGQTPLGGVWTGDSQVSSTGTFTATQVGPVTLTYTSGTGTCAVSDDRILTVQALPVVEAGSDTSICVNSPVFNFSGESPITAGTWTWTGIGISDGIVGTFSALQSGAGVFTSVYTYTETATGCSNADNLSVTVNGLTPVNVVDETLNVCLTPFNTMLKASPLGGVWTGNDINFLYNTDAVQDTAGFVPTVNGVFQAFYTYTDSNNCKNADTTTINVVSPIDAVAGPDVSFCYSLTDTYQLSGSPIVGSWVDPLNPTWLLEDGTLTPIQPDTTELIITIGSGSCQTWDTTQVVVFPLPFIYAGVDTFRCFQDPCFQLSTPIPTGGIWSGNGITDPNGLFCSTLAGEGVQVLYYNIDTTYYYQTVQSTCLNEDSIEVLVVPMPVPGLSIDPVLCVNVDYTLGNVSSGPAAEFEWTILSLPLNDTVFFSTDPAPTINLTVPGSYQLILNSISPYGCSVSTSSDFIVVTPPVPEFAISDDLGCAPYQGLIANTSSGYDLTYSWDFGPLFPLDSDVNPIMPVFPSPVIADSMYYVQLSLTNLCGTRTYMDSVVVRPQPFALITTDYSLGCSPMNIVIQNISYGSPESFLWDFGNGTSSNDSLPAPLVFSAQNFPQVFNIIVEVTNSCGISKDTSAVVIYPSSFSIGSIVPQTACAPYAFSFQSPLSGQTLYLWDFGDGEGAVGENVSHLYNDAGSYTLQLSVSNFCFTDTVYSTLNLLEGPLLDFDLSANSICENNEVSFTNSSILGSSYQWLIDGTGLISYSSTQTQTFLTGGDYQIGLAGTNPSSGCRDTIYSNFDVVSRPVINVIASPDTGCSPLTAQFINTTSNANSYQWMFSDGTGSSALSPTVVIPTVGNFSAELIAHNYQSGFVDCPDTAQINVLVHPTPQSIFSLAAEAGCGPPASVQTNNQSSINLVYTWTWENQNSTENSPLITFADTGYKAIELKVTNEFQCSDSSVLGYRVYGQPRIDFNLLPAEGCAPLNVEFQNLTQYGDSISWGFGDGNFSNLSLANHTYSEAGFYPVEVHVSSGNGLCFDDTLVSQAIHVFPVAYSAFQVDPLTISQTSPSISLYNSSSGYTDLEFYIDSNLIGNDLPGTYLFENPDSGFVQLVLIANNEYNCPDTTFNDVYVQSAPSIYYPNAFSPNGDGVNDGYKLFFDRAPTYYNVRIYDRWGHIVFKSRDYEEAWDGTYLNRGGEPIKSDVYVLKFSAFFEGSIRIDDLYKNVVLIR